MVEEGGSRPHHVVVLSGLVHQVIVHDIVLHHKASHGHVWTHHGELLGDVCGTVGARCELVHGRSGAGFRGPGGEQVVDVDVDGAAGVGPRGAELGAGLAVGGGGLWWLAGGRDRLQQTDGCRLNTCVDYNYVYFFCCL